MATKYTVKSGDTLFKIAEEIYNDGNKWRKIAEANPQFKPESLQVGDELTIPD